MKLVTRKKCDYVVKNEFMICYQILNEEYVLRKERKKKLR